MPTIFRLAFLFLLAGCAATAETSPAAKEAGMDLEARTGSNMMHKVRRKPAETPNERDADILEKSISSQDTLSR